jgi:hypothetical protein
LPDDLSRFLDQLVNDLTGRLELADYRTFSVRPF